MITGVYGQTINSYLSLKESKLDTTASMSKTEYLFKLTNDLTKAVKYVYGRKTTTNDRYIKLQLSHNTSPNMFSYQVDLKPYGFWKYEVYEVTWISTVVLNTETAPETEVEVLEEAVENGVVKGKVHEGKLYVQETSGSEQVKYTYHTETTTNYLYTN